MFRGGCKDEQSDNRELRIKIKGRIGEESGKLCAGRRCYFVYVLLILTSLRDTLISNVIYRNIAINRNWIKRSKENNYDKVRKDEFIT